MRPDSSTVLALRQSQPRCEAVGATVCQQKRKATCLPSQMSEAIPDGCEVRESHPEPSPSDHGRCQAEGITDQAGVASRLAVFRDRAVFPSFQETKPKTTTVDEQTSSAFASTCRQPGSHTHTRSRVRLWPMGDI